MIDFDITPYLHPSDPWPSSEKADDVLRCYRFKCDVARLLRPKKILEIGVRYGYSAAAFLAGSPGASYLGIDADLPAYGGSLGAPAEARSMLADRFPASSVEVRVKRSGDFTTHARFDFIHVDGDHSEEGCLADLHLAERVGCGWVLIDDIHHPKDTGVARAVSRFLHDTRHRHVYFDNTFRGDCLIQIGG